MKDLEVLFDQIHQGKKEECGFEKVGLLNKDDVAEMIREQQNT